MMNLDGSRPEPTSGGPGTVSQDEAEAGRLRVGVNLHAVEAKSFSANKHHYHHQAKAEVFITAG